MSEAEHIRALSLGLIGFPLTQSLSPRLHSAALQMMGLKGVYNLYPIQPDDKGLREISNLIQLVRNKEINGLNVTIPHKQTVMPLLDALTPRAKTIGAVNTIYWENGNVCGDNTDAPGFIQDFHRVSGYQISALDEEFDLSSAGWALVLGAGGAARAVVYALWKSGWHVACAARRLEQPNQMICDFLIDSKMDTSTVNRLEGLLLQENDLQKFLIKSKKENLVLLNASSAGMIPHIETSPWPEGFSFPEGAFVYDLVYKPSETRFLRDAREAGLCGSNGLGMLIEQAALALERWTLKPVPRDAMWMVVNDKSKPNNRDRISR